MIRILRENNNGLKEIPVECVKGATLLSREEAKNLLTQQKRMCQGTQQAKDNGLYVYFNGYSDYWLRSAGYDIDSACCVNSDGDVSNHYRVYDASIGVRPALIVNLPSSNLQVGDSFEFGDYTFKIISNNLALCDVIIDACPFNKKLEDGNNYETSYIKSRVGMWFQDEMDIANKRIPDSKLWDEMDLGF